MPKTLADKQAQIAGGDAVVTGLTEENKAAAESAAKAAVLSTASGALAVELDLGDF